MSGHWFYSMDTEGETPMSRALKSGHMALTEFMLRQERDDMPEYAAGETLLQRASYWGMDQAVRKLLAGGADPMERDDIGETALHKAARRGHADTVRALIESGADVNERRAGQDRFIKPSVAIRRKSGEQDRNRRLYRSCPGEAGGVAGVEGGAYAGSVPSSACLTHAPNDGVGV